MTPARCPCCGSVMDPSMVTCWACFRLTEKLTPGRYRHTVRRYAGMAFTLSRVMIQNWDKARERRRQV